MDPHLFQQLSIFVGLIVFGAALVAGGVMVGVHVARGQKKVVAAEEVRLRHLMEMVGSLSNWTQGFAGDVTQYGSRLKDLVTQVEKSGELQCLSGDSKDSNVLAELLQANELLRQRLQSAEESLAEKAQEVQDYLSQARTDQLTQLPNRRAFEDECSSRFAQWQRYSTPLSLVIVDIDHFKKINDNHGHLVGDKILKSVGQQLNLTVRDSDLLVRFGGEEFAVIMPCSNVTEAGLAALRLCQAIEQCPMEVETTTFEVTISCGAAQVVGGDTMATLIQRADEALYAAKNEGRNRAFYHDGIRPRHVGGEKPVLADELRGGIPTRFNQVCDELRSRLIEVTER
jgi:diguanylate cyclase